MLWLLIFVGIVASAIAGVLTDWLLKAWLPEKPRTKHVVASTVAIVVLLTIAAIASSIGSLPKPTDTNPTSVTPQVLMVSDITPTVARGENRAGGGGGRIAFVSSINNNDEIFVANVDGSALTNITNNAAVDFAPTWSPDGTKIAFTSDRGGGEYRVIYIMNSDGNDIFQLTDPTRDSTDPSWSPDGRRIAFSRSLGETGIYLIDIDGTNLTGLSVESDSEPNWSPDGTKIVFSSFRDDNGEIYVMNSDGTNLRNLTNDPSDDVNPTWSPNGTQIIFASYRNGNEQLYIMNADGSNQIRLTNNVWNDYQPEWSPDGAWIVFVSDRGGDNDIYIIPLMSPSTAETVTHDDTNDFVPSWQP